MEKLYEFNSNKKTEKVKIKYQIFSELNESTNIWNNNPHMNEIISQIVIQCTKINYMCMLAIVINYNLKSKISP